MSYTLSAVDGRQNPPLTTGLESFLLWFPLKIAQANNALTLPEGYLATYLSRPGPPDYQTAPWCGAGYQIDGGPGRDR